MMQILLLISAGLLGITGLAHSYLGERYILIRLFKSDSLPKLFGSDDFTRRTLRFAWHITTIACWGFAAILVLMASAALNFQNVATALAATFLLSAATAFVGSKGKHLSWVVFLFVGVVCLWAAIV
ncbi:MAG: hypothetical protein K9H23_04825 [Saprospiraceae bacterium]|nr:hypothetical protein [Saprospiraceae bacterium]